MTSGPTWQSATRLGNSGRQDKTRGSDGEWERAMAVWTRGNESGCKRWPARLWWRKRGASWARGKGGGRQEEAMIWWRRLADKWRDVTAEWHWWLQLRGRPADERGTAMADDMDKMWRWWRNRGLIVRQEEQITVADKGYKGFAVYWPRKVWYFLIPLVNRGSNAWQKQNITYDKSRK